MNFLSLAEFCSTGSQTLDEWCFRSSSMWGGVRIIRFLLAGESWMQTLLWALGIMNMDKKFQPCLPTGLVGPANGPDLGETDCSRTQRGHLWIEHSTAIQQPLTVSCCPLGHNFSPLLWLSYFCSLLRNNLLFFPLCWLHSASISQTTFIASVLVLCCLEYYLVNIFSLKHS